MAISPLPAQDVLNQLLEYDRDSGILTWRQRSPDLFGGKRDAEISARIWNTRYAGKPAFIKSRFGYLIGAIFGRGFMAHRVIWKMVTGEDPIEIDHINGIRDDNRWVNLRNVTGAENRRNMCIRSDNRSGNVGVSRFERTDKWQAYIVVAGKTQHLGFFDLKQDAVLARRAAEAELGFHKNHGRPR